MTTFPAKAASTLRGEGRRHRALPSPAQQGRALLLLFTIKPEVLRPSRLTWPSCFDPSNRSNVGARSTAPNLLAATPRRAAEELRPPPVTAERRLRSRPKLWPNAIHPRRAPQPSDADFLQAHRACRPAQTWLQHPVSRDEVTDSKPRKTAETDLPTLSDFRAQG